MSHYFLETTKLKGQVRSPYWISGKLKFLKVGQIKDIFLEKVKSYHKFFTKLTWLRAASLMKFYARWGLARPELINEGMSDQ